METVKNSRYDVQLIRPGTVVYLGGSDNTTSHEHQFRGVIHRVSVT